MQIIADNAPLYLDYQATTPCDERVVEKMLPYLSKKFGNPHSRNHAYGWDAEEAVENARGIIADGLGCDPREVIFTSGATESNNLAIKGVMLYAALEYPNKKFHFITSVVEHPCVLECFRLLEHEGHMVTYIPVDTMGRVNPEDIQKALMPETKLVSIMAVSNEIGVIQPIREIGKICRNHGVFFHTDAAQAFGKVPLNVEDDYIDLLSLSSHKIYGPKGIGALYLRRRNPRVRIRPLFSGGGQERGMRSGTLAPFLCVGFGEAARLSKELYEEESARLLSMRKSMWEKISSQLDRVYMNGDIHHRIPGNLNISFAGVEGEGLMMGLKDLALSSGSACTSASLEPSYVLKAVGLSDDLAHTSLRISLGRFTQESDVEYASSRIVEAVNHLRSMSPLWDMYQEGIDVSQVQWVAH